MDTSPVPEWGHLFVPNKLDYVQGKRPEVDCIMCALRDRDPRVERLIVHEAEHWFAALNLYPYNPGHLLLFPRRHVVDIRELTRAESRDLDRMQRAALDVLEDLYQPHGFNIGFNLGRSAGASVAHLHLHIVPRYAGEAGFMDMLVATRTIVEDPKRTKRRLRNRFKKMLG